MAVVKRYNVPLMLDDSWADELTSTNNPQVFRIGVYNSLVAGLMAPYLVFKHYKKVAVLAEDTDYGIGFAKSLVEAANGNPTIEVVQYQAQTQDLTPTLNKLKNENPVPDAVVVAGVYPVTFTVYNQAAEVGLKSDMIAGWDYVVQTEFWKDVGKNGIGVTYPTFSAPSLKLTPTGEQFRSQFKGKYSQDPVIYLYFLWDLLNAIKQAAQSANSTDPSKLVSALPSVSFEGTTGPIKFAHQPGTVHFNQWEGVTEYFKQFTAVGQTDDTAPVVFTSNRP
jgi:branched-chain amino acid transport system substrate-binding protein